MTHLGIFFRAEVINENIFDPFIFSNKTTQFVSKMGMTRKTDFRKMTISHQRWIEIIQNPLVLFHHIYVPTKCAYRDQIREKIHFSHMVWRFASLCPRFARDVKADP